MEWQPIATAPDDGLPFLVYGPELVHEDFTPTGVMEGFRSDWGDQSAVVLGRVWDGYMDAWTAEPVNATHWMPLPAPPLTP